MRERERGREKAKRCVERNRNWISLNKKTEGKINKSDPHCC